MATAGENKPVPMSSSSLAKGPGYEVLGQHVAFWQWNLSDNALHWSDRLIKLLGQDNDSFVPTLDSFFSIVHPDDLARVQAAIEAHLADGEPYRLDFRHRHADGHYLHCRTEGALVQSQGEGPNYMMGVTFDVTDQVEAQSQLNDSEKRLATLAANFDGAVFRYRMKADGTDSIDYMSDGAEKVWGLTAPEIIGDPGKVWATVHPEDVAGVEAAFVHGTQNLTRLNHRWRVVLPDGVARWIECRAAPKRLESGDTLWDGFVIDVSEAMAAREELRAKTEMLGQAQKMEAIGRIAGGIAHDFNNLLAIVLGNAELIEDSRLDDMDRESLEAIISACSKGADLTRRLLSFARKSRLDPEVVHLADIVQGMMPFVQRVLPESITLDFTTDSGTKDTVSVDVGLLESSVLNVVLNARDAMPRGGTITLRLSDGGTAGQGFVVLEIQDTGEGIPDDLLPRVTEPFVTSKGPEMGSGLGLAMVDGFVDQSGGRLEIVSKVGTGTTVRLHLPTTSEAPTRQPRAGAGNLGSDKVSARVLLVEDEQRVRLTTSRQLRQLGIQVDAVETGEDALRFLEKRGDTITLLISDVVMPGEMDGVELARVFRKRYPSKPAILISGYTATDSIDSAQQDPLTVRLVKPVKREVLETTIADVLARAGDG
ncbi:MAG: PAS domain-containing protein [Paracoccaceae bacterium]|nr:PAS domain-containing protein [Paracoccaceae bacterium]